MNSGPDYARTLHREAIVINCLSMGRRVDDLAGPMLAGGVTAINWTVAAPGIDFLVNDMPAAIKSIAEARYATTVGKRPAKIIETVEDIRACKREGLAGIILGFQDTLVFEDRIELVGVFHRLGVRIVQITYQRRNLVGDGCGEPVDAGLSTFGREVIRELNRLGILIDLSHVGPRTTEEAIDASEAPCSFTHVNAHAVYSHIRNKADEALRKVVARGGVIGVNAVSRFLRADGHAKGTTIDDLVDHIAHIADLVGSEHVGLGLDITEGMTLDDVRRRGNWLSAQLPEVSSAGSLNCDTYYPKGLRSMDGIGGITEAMLRRGFSDKDILGILGGNFVRLFEVVWR